MMRIVSLGIAVMVVVALALPASAAWVLLDDFEGDLSNWTTNDEAVVSIVADPDGPVGNHVLYLPDPGTTDNSNLYIPLGANTIADNTTGTLFGRIRVASLTTANAHFGLSYLAAPSAPADWTLWAGWISIDNGGWQVRDDGYKDTDQHPTALTWINFWIVLNNSADTYNVYYTYGDDSVAESGVKMTIPTDDDTFAFRTEAAGLALPALLVRAPLSNASYWHLDDVYIDSTGENLAYPGGSVGTVVGIR